MNILTNLLGSVSPQSDGDMADRLNYFVTTVALIVTSAFVVGWSFVGQPIQCWFPKYYRGSWMEYALDYCFVQNTFFVPILEKDSTPNLFHIAQHMASIPINDTVKETHQIGYYQWVPFILALQALMFYMPVLFWRVVYETSGFKVGTILNNCAQSANMDEETRKKNMKTIASFLVQDHTVSSSAVGSSLRRFSSGRYIVFAYLVSKLFYVFNALLQFVFLKKMLGVESYFWGFEMARDLAAGNEWPETGNFPRVTMCDFTVRVLGNTHKHTVQCVLMINMFNEKIFMAIWFWLCFMLLVSSYSACSWFASTMFSSSGTSFVSAYIKKIDPSVYCSLHKKDLLREFVSRNLRPDGVFLIRLVESNHGDMVTCALLKTLWDDFVTSRGERQPPTSKPLLIKKRNIAESEL